MRIGIWPDQVTFKLQVEVANTKRINVLSSQLNRPFVSPPSGSFLQVVQEELIQHKLPVEGNFSYRIDFEVHPQQNVVAAAILLFNSPEKDHRIKVAEFKIASPQRVIRTKNNRLKQANID